VISRGGGYVPQDKFTSEKHCPKRKSQGLWESL
jgi:hypothetical protein